VVTQIARIMPASIPPVTAQIDHACLDRLAAGVAEYRAEIGEAKWAQLQKEWGA
jgi:hypothetical protein